MKRSGIGKIKGLKNDHLEIALSKKAQIGDAGFENYRFVQTLNT